MRAAGVNQKLIEAKSGRFAADLTVWFAGLRFAVEQRERRILFGWCDEYSTVVF